MKITKRKIFIFIVSAAVTAGGFLAWRILGKGDQEPVYTTVPVEKGMVISTVSTSGNLTQTNTFIVTTGVTGVVKEVFVKDGEEVEKGQKLVEIELDQSGEQARLKAWASYLSAKTAVASAEENKLSLEKGVEDAKEALEALDSGLRSAEISLEIAEQKYDRADEAIDKAKLDLNSAWVSYQLTLPIITAPQSGKISDISVAPGMMLSSSTSADQTSNSQKLLTIVGEQKLLLSVSVNEIDIGQIAADQKATITFDSLVDKTFTGKVVGVDRTGNSTQGVVTYPVLIQLDTGGDDVFANMSATAEIIIESRKDALWIPPAAVRTQDGQTVVRVLVNGQVQEKTVEVGLETSDRAEIKSGLSEGEVVVVSEQTTSGGTTFGGGGGMMGIMGGGGGPR